MIGVRGSLEATRARVIGEPAVFQSIVDNALAATGVRVVALILSEADGKTGRVVAHAGLFSSLVHTATDAARRLIPGFDPANITVLLGANPVVQPVYEEGCAVSGPFGAISAGNVGERMVEIASAVAGIRWSHVYPLRVGGRVAGSLSFHGPEELPAPVQNVCDAFAQQASLTLDNAQLVAQERQRTARAECLAAVLSSVGAAEDLDGALRALLMGAVALLEGERGSADVFKHGTGERILKMRLEPDGAIETVHRPGPPGAHGYGRRVMEEGRAVVLDDYQGVRPEQGLWRERGMRATICVPIVASGRAIGSFHVDHPTVGHFTRADARLAEVLGAQAGEVIERARLAETVRAEQVERARLDGALLVARTTAHEINNALSPVVGYAELLTMQPGLSPAAARYAGDIMAGAINATERVRQLQRIVRLDESSISPAGQSLLDLDRSTAPEAAD